MSDEVYTRQARMPLEQAIELIESEIDKSTEKVLLTDLIQQCRDKAPEAEPILDHTIQVFIRGGFMKRRTDGPGTLGYVKTELWSNRDEVLITLRAPPYKYRYRSYESRVRGRRKTASEATIDGMKEKIRE